MKTFNLKSVLVLMSMLTASGIAFAENGSFQFSPRSAEQQANVEELLNQGAISKLTEQDWYQVEASYFQLLQTNTQTAEAEQQRTINILKGITGESTSTRSVPLHEAAKGSQDSGF